MEYENKKGPSIWIGLALLTVALWLFVSAVMRSFREGIPDTQEEEAVVGSREKVDLGEIFAEGDLEEETEEILTKALAVPGFASEDFLRTDYEPLEAWMNESFEVKYRGMTPQLIFDQVPLNDIFYEVVDLDEKKKQFEFSSGKVSRRELLRKIAEHWDLEMEYVVDESGTPTAVAVKEP